MPELIGVITSPLPAHLKQYALLFDRFTSPDLAISLFSWSLIEEGLWSANELEWLIEQGIVFYPELVDEVESADEGLKDIYDSHVAALSNAIKEMRSNGELMRSKMVEIFGLAHSPIPEGLEAKYSGMIKIYSGMINRIIESDEEFREMVQSIKSGDVSFEMILSDIGADPDFAFFVFMIFLALQHQVPKVMPLNTRTMAVKLRMSGRYDAFPILRFEDNYPLVKKTTNRGDVVEVVVNKLPIPDDSVSWEQILDYRSDPDSHGKFMGLRVWMSEVARSELTQREVEEKLEWLMHDYERHLKLHKMKYSTGTLETIVTVGAEFLENMVKFKWGKAAKALFAIKHKRIELLEAEMRAPGSEVAYLVESRKKFKEE